VVVLCVEVGREVVLDEIEVPLVSVVLVLVDATLILVVKEESPVELKVVEVKVGDEIVVVVVACVVEGAPLVEILVIIMPVVEELVRVLVEGLIVADVVVEKAEDSEEAVVKSEDGVREVEVETENVDVVATAAVVATVAVVTAGGAYLKL
jgi:hypothetical protein